MKTPFPVGPRCFPTTILAALALAACAPKPAASSAPATEDRPPAAGKEQVKPTNDTPTTADKVKVAAIQFESEFGVPASNRRRIEPLVREAAKAGARIVVLPETCISGYMSADIRRTWRVGNRTLSSGLSGESPKEVAETVPGPSTEAFGKLADELDIYLTIPFLEVDPKTGRYFNTVVLASPEGKLLLHYRKLNPWMWAEQGWATKGDRGLQYVDTPYGRLGLLICYDINFEPPHLREAGIDILLYSIAWVDEPKSDWFTVRLPDIARENHLHIIGANWTFRQKPEWSGYGHSLVLDNKGQTLAKVGDDLREEIIFAELPVTRSAR